MQYSGASSILEVSIESKLDEQPGQFLNVSGKWWEIDMDNEEQGSFHAEMWPSNRREVNNKSTIARVVELGSQPSWSGQSWPVLSHRALLK